MIAKGAEPTALKQSCIVEKNPCPPPPLANAARGMGRDNRTADYASLRLHQLIKILMGRLFMKGNSDRGRRRRKVIVPADWLPFRLYASAKIALFRMASMHFSWKSTEVHLTRRLQQIRLRCHTL